MRLSQICIAITQLARGAGAWSPLALWPDGIDTPGMWISPRDLTSEWQDYTGTTPVSTPGTVADSSNPVGLALDLRAGTPVLGPELVDNLAPAVGVAVLVGANTYELIGSPGYMFSWSDIGQEINKTYLVNGTVSSLSSGSFVIFLNGVSVNVSSNGDYSFRLTTTSSGSGFNCYTTANNGTVISFFVREVPGNHMLQSTSSARPLMSARVNLLTYTEDFSGWVVNNGSLSAATPPDGITAATRYTWAGGGGHTRIYGGAVAATTASTYSILARAGTGFTYLNIRFENSPSNVGICVNLLTGAITAGHYDGVYPLTAPSASGAVDYGNGWWRIDITNGSFGTTFLYPSNNADSTNDAYTAGDYFDFTALQLNRGSTAFPYQAILTDGSSYPSTGFPIAQLYDGVDDGMATAAFSAGTLIDGMDCMIPVRRDSAALPAIGGLYQADQTKYFGVIGIGSGDAAPTYGGCGAPSLFVDGIAVANKRGALYDALGVGEWHILEYRGLDLSAWVNAAWGAYPVYQFNGPRGDILLYPSTTPTEDKDAARQWLADYYGVTLP